MASFIKTVIAPATPKVFGGDRFTFLVGADDDTTQAVADILQIRRQGQDSHDFAGNSDIKA